MGKVTGAESQMPDRIGSCILITGISDMFFDRIEQTYFNKNQYPSTIGQIVN